MRTPWLSSRSTDNRPLAALLQVRLPFASGHPRGCAPHPLTLRATLLAITPAVTDACPPWRVTGTCPRHFPCPMLSGPTLTCICPLPTTSPLPHPQEAATLGTPLFALCHHPAPRVTEGAALLMRAVAESGAAAAAPMRAAALRHGALLHHLHAALFAGGPATHGSGHAVAGSSRQQLGRALVASWCDEYAPALALLRRWGALMYIRTHGDILLRLMLFLPSPRYCHLLWRFVLMMPDSPGLPAPAGSSLPAWCAASTRPRLVQPPPPPSPPRPNPPPPTAARSLRLPSSQHLPKQPTHPPPMCPSLLRQPQPPTGRRTQRHLPLPAASYRPRSSSTR